MHEGVTFSVLRTTAEFEATVPEWNEMWLADAGAKPFQRPEWLLTWWRQFGQRYLYAVCVRRAGRLTGLVPMYVYEDAGRGERQLLLVGAGTSDYLDGIFRADCTPEQVREALGLLALEETWDVAHMTQMLPVSPLYRALAGMGSAGVRGYAGEGCSRCPALPVADLPNKVRSEVRYFRNAAIGRGRLRMEVAEGASAAEAFEVLVRLHTARWEGSGEPGVLADPAVLRWHREAVPLLQAAGCLRIYVLYLDEVAVAALYGLVDPVGREGRCAYFYLIGYSPAHAALKPGTLLTAMASEHAASEGVETIDMLRGEESYKKFWHVEEIATFGFSFSREVLSREVSAGGGEA